MLDLILPRQCGGCGTPATRWCDACAAALEVGADAPHVLTPRLDPGVPAFALGRYAGPRRQAIVALKEHGRTDLCAPLARALAVGVHRLIRWGVVPEPLSLVPAPTRRSSARRRGGDPVTRLARAAVAGHSGVAVVPALAMRGFVRDSVGLDSRGRERNVAGRVRLRTVPPRTPALLIDDIVTTGATARESVGVLRAAGVDVVAILALAHA